MASRIEIELTSQKDPDTWTWRAAGAKLPKGTVRSSVLYDGARPGDIVRAEADFALDGIEILSVTPPARKVEKPVNRIEVTGSRAASEGGVTTSLAPKKGGKDRRERRPRRDDREVRESQRPARRSEGRPARERPTATPRPKRLAPASRHRNQVLDGLTPEVRSIAEKVLRGGVPAVRQELEQENRRAKAEGRPVSDTGALVTLAEELLPRLKSAEWMDRAEAAQKDIAEISMRDLRALVATADTHARSEDARALADRLRSSLTSRTEAERDKWLGEIKESITENRLVRALNLSTRPPDPAAKFPPDLLGELSDAASKALSADAPPDRWLTILEAVAASPVRRTVKPAGLPLGADDGVKARAAQVAGRVPALGAMLGIKVPPPPRPRRPAKVTSGTEED